ncbi:hypothetical protein V6N13_104239 [Hibiscus sabdariffa]
MDNFLLKNRVLITLSTITNLQGSDPITNLPNFGIFVEIRRVFYRPDESIPSKIYDATTFHPDQGGIIVQEVAHLKLKEKG